MADLRWWPFKGPPNLKALTANTTVPEAIRDGWTPWRVLGGANRQRIQDAYNTAQSAGYAWMYTNSPAVRGVIDVLVRNIGQLDLRLYEEIDEAERQPRPEHPAALSLRYPSEDVSGDQLIRSLIKDFLIFDNAYALLTPVGEQLGLNWIPAHMIEVRGASLFRADGYRVWMRDGTFADFPPDRILHWVGENPHDPRMGYSRLETLRNAIAEDAALQQATVELANAGLTEPAWVYRPLEAPPWTGEARDRFEEDLTNRLKRRTKAPVVLEEGMEMKSFGVSPREAQMSEIRRWSTSQVANIYGVPLGMVGLDDNLEDAQKQFYSDTLPPYCEAFCRMLNQRILVRAYNWTDGCFEFNLDEKYMGDERWKALVSASGRPIMLTNEARAKVNLPPVDGGDELVTPSNVIVGEKPSVDVMPIQDPNKPDQGGGYRIEEEAQPVKALTGETAVYRPQSGILPPTPLGGGAATVFAAEDQPVPHHDPRIAEEHNRQLRNIDAFQAITSKHFNRLGRELVERRDRSYKGHARYWGKRDRDFAEGIHRELERIIEQEGNLYAFKLGGHFDMEQVRHYIRAMADGSAEGINEKVRADVSTLGLEDTISRFPTFAQASGAGLGANATRWAREEAARQSPDPDGRVKTWVADTGRHAEHDGTRVRLTDDWPAGFAPGNAPNCKCSQTIE